MRPAPTKKEEMRANSPAPADGAAVENGRAVVCINNYCSILRRRDNTDVFLLMKSGIMDRISSKTNSRDVTGSFDNGYFVRMNIVAG